MKLSKQERIAALIILAVIVLALGAFLLVKPAIQTWTSTAATLVSKQAELKKMEDRRATKGQLRKDIEAAYEEGEHLADMFFPELKSYESEDAFREFLKQCDCNVIVEQVTVGEPSTASLGATFFTPENVEYALKTYATTGVALSEEEQIVKARNEALMTALAESQTIGASTIEFAVTAKSRDTLFDFADAVNDYMKQEADGRIRKAIMLNGLTLEYDEVNEYYDALIEENLAEMDIEGKAALAAEVGADAPVIEREPEEEEEKEPSLEGYLFTYEGTMTIFSIERMQDPKAQLDAQDGK